ncbi:MFS monocarboxylate transporter [Thozetella sp. PMI_491]|nr:MFS monocarboxylate transporter [Thozetella sp. PMI_491]
MSNSKQTATPQVIELVEPAAVQLTSDPELVAESLPPEFSLPRADGGKDAWLVLTACFILEALVWGFPFAFGVFQAHYSTHELFSHDLASIAAIGTTASGVMYFSAPIVYTLLRKFPKFRKPSAAIGFVVLLASLIGASFANSVTQLLLTQGVLYGIGGTFHYFPAFLYLDEWFIQRKGLAYGVLNGGGGAAGVVIPLLMQWILSNWGFRTALRTWVVITIVLTTPAVMWLKPRLPDQHAHQGPQKVELGFFKSRAFWILQTGNIISSLGYFMPSLYMPSFAAAQGWGAVTGTVAVCLCNAANVLGSLFAGWMIDRYHVTTAINTCVVGTVVGVFVFWTFAVYRPVLYIFAICYGIFAGGFSSTWTGCTQPVRRKYPAVETGMMIAVFSAGKGIGAVISGPLSGALMKSDAWRDHIGYGFGSGYGYLIVFTGVTASFASIGWFGKLFGAV